MSEDTHDTTAYKFGSTLIEPTPICCGVQLRPFSMGHLILLRDVLHSVLLSAETKEVGNEFGVVEFFKAILICAMTYENGKEFISNISQHCPRNYFHFIDNKGPKFLQKFIKWIVNKPNAWLNRKLLVQQFLNNLNEIMKHKSFNTLNEIIIFENYLRYYIDIPKFKILQQNDDFPSGSDEITSTLIIFKELNYEETEVMNMGFNRLQVIKCSILENRGVIRVCEKRVVEYLKNSGKL
jgi:hypothetical protein